MNRAVPNTLPLRVLKQKFEALFGLDNSNLSESVSKFKSWIDSLYSKPHQSIAAGNISLSDAISIFGLDYDPEPTYNLGQPSQHVWILNNEGTSRPHAGWLGPALKAAGRRMTSRFIIELILLDRMETLEVHNPLRIVDKVDLEYVIEDPAIPGKMLRISGRADVCVAYSTEGPFASRACLVVLETGPKNAPDELGQLLSYLAIVQRKRKQAEKTHVTVYGILTNGIEWRFVRLDGETRLVSVSGLHDPYFSKYECNRFQNFLGEILDAISRSLPTTIPTQPPLPYSPFFNPEEAERSDSSGTSCLAIRYGESDFIVLDEEGNPQEGIPYDTMLYVIQG